MIVSLVSQKGEVGETSMAIFLAVGLSRTGKKPSY